MGQGLLTDWSTGLRRRLTLGILGGLTVVMVGMTSPAHTAAATTGFIADAVCVVQGTMTFSPAAGALPTPGTLVSVTVTSSTCAGVPAGLAVSIGISGTATSSCEAGVLSTLGGTVAFPGSSLPTIFVSGTFIGAPSSALVELMSADDGFASTLDLTWSSPAVSATCPVAPTGSTAVLGVFDFSSH